MVRTTNSTVERLPTAVELLESLRAERLRYHLSMKEDVLDRLTLLADRRDGAVWQEAAELIRRAGDYRWVGLYEVTDTEIGAIAWTGTVAPSFPRFPRDQGLNGVAVATKAAVVSQDVANDPRYLTAFATTGSEAIFPVLAANGQVIGTIDVESDRRNAFSLEDEQFPRACAVALGRLWQSFERKPPP